MADPAPTRPRKQEDWISSYLRHTEGYSSPEIFRLWTGIATVAGALERRTWVVTKKSLLYPNLFTLLVSNPGIGKSQAIQHVGEFWLATKQLKVSPDNMTKAALVDALEASSRNLILNETTLVEFHSLNVAASEFGVLVPAHDLDFLSVLNHIYDNPPYYRELRRGRKDEDDIIKPQLNIIAGTQPAYLANLLPEAAWGQGFCSRLIMIYSGDRTITPLFATEEGITAAEIKLKNDLIMDLTTMTTLYGQMKWTEPAKELATKLDKEGIKPVPEHSKLEHYNARRIVHVIKLSMISSASRGNSLIIEEQDVERAKGWLLHAEEFMPDIFKEMVQRSDSQVISDLHFFAYRIYMKEKKPVHKVRLIHFLQHRVPSEKVERVLDIAVKANILDLLAGTETYIPRPKNEHGEE